MTKPFAIERKRRTVHRLDEGAQRSLNASNRDAAKDLASAQVQEAKGRLTPQQFGFWLQSMRRMVGPEVTAPEIVISEVTPREAAEALFCMPVQNPSGSVRNPLGREDI